VNRLRHSFRLDKTPIRFPIQPADRQAEHSFKQTFLRAFRVMAPALLAISFASVSYGQGTMDFSGAQTLMGTFNWRNDYVGVEQWSRFIREGNYCYHTQLYAQHERFAKTWDNNLRQQGFDKNFTDKCIVG
jgi:hypothetical protein